MGKKHLLFFLTVTTALFTTPFFAQSSRVWATYYGGSSQDIGTCVITDPSGNVYIAGNTLSSSGIAFNGFQNSFGGLQDGFLVKFDAAGNRLWATYYGGADGVFVNDIKTDLAGNIYLAGTTACTTSIASGGFQNSFAGGGSDAFLVKFDGAGNRLWATYYGGPSADQGQSVTTDAAGNVFLGGNTSSTTGIASGGFQNTFTGAFSDAFLVKFDAAGNRLWATYYGGMGEEDAPSLATDGAGNVFLAGITNSTSAIASGGFQNTYGGGLRDAYLVKFDAAGNRIWATYYGDTDDDRGYDVATNAAGDIFLAGLTGSAANIASGGFQNTFASGPWDAYLVKFGTAGNRVWATYYGGNDIEEGYSVAIDPAGNIYLAGDTYSLAGVASGGFQGSLGGTENEFVVTFDASGNRLCATYYGQSHDEDGRIAVDNLGNVYLVAYTASSSGIASGGFQNTFGGGGFYDAYLVKFTSCGSTLSASAVSTPVLCNGQCNGTATVTASGGTGPYTYLWNSSPAQTGTTATGLCAGNYTVTVTDALGATSTVVVGVSQPPPLQTTAASAADTCSGGNGSASVSAFGGSPGYTYLWSNGSVNDSTANLSAGTYWVTVTDINGCTVTSTVTVAATGTAAADAGNAVVIQPGQSTALIGTGGGSYSWSPGTGLSCTNCPGPIASPTVTTTYTLTVTGSNGCTATDTVTVFVIADISCGELYLPNAFSPNGDGENDVLYVRGNCIKYLQLEIYSRWGEKVFFTGDPAQGWNGSWRGKACEADVFTYVLKATLLDGTEIAKKGNISLVK